MIQQAYKYVSSSLWPCLAFFEVKITNILKSSGWGLEQSELPWNNDLRCKLVKIALFMYLRSYWVECMTSSAISFAYFTYFSNLIYPELMQIFANGKWRIDSFVEFCVIHLKYQGVKI